MTTLFSRLRLRSVAGALAMLLVLLKPTPAQAWFGWLDEWSGPGGWFGVLIDVRLVCFGPPIDMPATREQMTRAMDLFENAISLPKPTDPAVITEQLSEAMRLHATAMNQLEVAQLRSGAPAADRRTVNSYRNLRSLMPGLFRIESTGVVTTRELTEAVSRLNSEQVKNLTAVLNAKKNEMAAFYATVERNVEIQVGTGVFISLCSTKVVRRASIEINANQWFTKDDAYVNNNLIWFSTIAPSFTWKVASAGDYDFLDIGASAGVYTVRAKGLDSFAGFVIEPIRADIHGPTSWHSSTNGFKKFASLVTFRAGLTMFPAGFEAGALPRTDGTKVAIKSEWIPTYGIFFKAMR